MAFECRKYLCALAALLTVMGVAACGGGSYGGGWLNLVTASAAGRDSSANATGW